MSISCCAAEASEDVTRSTHTLAGCQHRRRLILTLSRRPQDYNTHADSSRFQFNTAMKFSVLAEKAVQNVIRKFNTSSSRSDCLRKRNLP